MDKKEAEKILKNAISNKQREVDEVQIVKTKLEKMKLGDIINEILKGNLTMMELAILGQMMSAPMDNFNKKM